MALDTAVADTAANDTAVAETAVDDTAVAETALDDTDLAVDDTAVADTAVADTAVADTAVDASVADSAPDDADVPAPRCTAVCGEGDASFHPALVTIHGAGVSPPALDAGDPSLERRYIARAIDVYLDGAIADGTSLDLVDPSADAAVDVASGQWTLGLRLAAGLSVGGAAPGEPGYFAVARYVSAAACQPDSASGELEGAIGCSGDVGDGPLAVDVRVRADEATRGLTATITLEPSALVGLVAPEQQGLAALVVTGPVTLVLELTAWTCYGGLYGDGVCDCGCGGLDSDCAGSSDIAACGMCACGDRLDCADVDPSDTTRCR
ncbi:MAG: hypothetical protein U1F43_02800 [Myxococcota bacterium]